jgi:hypothetical protein
MLMWKEYCLEHGKGSELLDNQQRTSRDDAKKNIFFKYIAEFPSIFSV